MDMSLLQGTFNFWVGCSKKEARNESGASEDLVSTRQSWTCRAAKQCLTTKFVPALSWAVCRGGERQGLRPNKKPRLVSHRGFRGPGVGLHGGTNLDDAWPHQRECRGASSLAGPANFIRVEMFLPKEEARTNRASLPETSPGSAASITALPRCPNKAQRENWFRPVRGPFCLEKRMPNWRNEY